MTYGRTYRCYSKLRTHTVLGAYGRVRPRGIDPPRGRCVSLFTSNTCIAVLVVGSLGQGNSISRNFERGLEIQSTEILTGLLSTRWISTLSSEVNLPHAIKFRALCGTNMVRQPSDIRGNESCTLHRVERIYSRATVSRPAVECSRMFWNSQ